MRAVEACLVVRPRSSQLNRSFGSFERELIEATLAEVERHTGYPRRLERSTLPQFLHAVLRFLLHLGFFGPFVMGIMDSSFLFLPFGNDLLVVTLTARHHADYLIYVVSAVCGSTLGVFFLDLMSRRLGEEGVKRVAGEKRFASLKRRIGQRGFVAIFVACLAPPPFPFTMVIAILCALGYPRPRLLIGVAASRGARFLILGYLAIRFGRQIIHVINSAPFKWTMIGFIVLCLVMSVLSLLKWFKSGRTTQPVAATA